MECLNYKIFEKFDDILACSTLKSQQLPYLGSLALHTGESIDDIAKNRDRLKDYFPKDSTFVSVTQVHGDNIADIDSIESIDWNMKDSDIRADAIVTQLPKVVLTILTADCVPILLYEPNRRVVSAIHAGWRGSDKKIAIKTVEYMHRVYGCNPSDIVAVIAPAIGGCCYEVDESVASKFGEYSNSLIVTSSDRYMLDLKRVNYTQLLSSGLRDKNIEISPLCTSCSSDILFSYRKEGGCSGRFISAIMMK